MDDFITTTEAARVIGCNDSRVRQLARSGAVAGKRVGRDWLIDRRSAEGYAATDRRPGRKKGDGTEATGEAAGPG